MATEEETIRLSLDASGVQVGSQKAASAIQGIGTAAQTTTKVVDQAADATHRLDEASRKSAFAVTNLARATQDFAFGGLPAISNNVEQLIPALAHIGTVGFAAFAGPAGIAAGLTVVATFWPNIQRGAVSLFELFREGEVDTSAFADSVGRIETRIKELEKLNPVTISVEAEELGKLRSDLETIKKLRSEIDQFLGAKSPAERESSKRIAEELSSRPGGPGGIAEEVTRQREIRGQAIGTGAQQATLKRLAERLKDAEDAVAYMERNGITSGALYEGDVSRRDDLKNQLRIARQQARQGDTERVNAIFAQATFGDAEKDPLKRKGTAFYQQEAARLAREAGLDDVAGLFERESVGSNKTRMDKEARDKAAKETRDQETEDLNLTGAANERIGQEQARRDKQAHEAETQELNKAGQENERIGKQQAAKQDAEARKEATARNARLDSWIKQAGGLEGVEATLFDLQTRGFSGGQAREIATTQARGFGRQMGLGRDQAAAFAARAVDRARENLEAMGQVNTNQETRANTTATERLTTAIERMERRGVPMVLRRGR